MQSLKHEKCPRCGGPVLLAAEGICFSCMTGGSMLDPVCRVGPYEMVEKLGEGGMGVVHRARHIAQRRDVALKLMLNPLYGKQEARRRFEMETEALASLDHPWILPLYESGETDEGTLWYAMKLARGGTLTRRRERLTGEWKACAEIVEKVALAVDHAHRAGIIHRDLKPANILFDEENHPYVADFGIAGRADRTQDELTLTGGFMGVPVYSAPEILARGAKYATIASDVYALGVILYELLTGKLPFSGETESALLGNMAAAPAQPPRSLNPSIPRDLSDIAMKALSYETARRYATAADLAADLRAWLENRPVTARSVYAWERTRLWVRRRPLVATLIALLVVVAVIYNVAISRALARAERGEKSAEDQVAYMTVALPDVLEPLGKLDLLEIPYSRVASFYEQQPLEDSTISGLENRMDFYIRWVRVKERMSQRDDQSKISGLAVKTADFLMRSREDEATARAFYLAARVYQHRAEFMRDRLNTRESKAAMATAEDVIARGKKRFENDPLIIQAFLEWESARFNEMKDEKKIVTQAPDLESGWKKLFQRESFDGEPAIQKYGRIAYSVFMTTWAQTVSDSAEERRAILLRRLNMVDQWRKPGNKGMEILYAEANEWLGQEYMNSQPVDRDAAAKYLNTRLEITTRLAEVDAGNMWYQQHLSNAHANLSRYYRLGNNFAGERRELEESLKCQAKIFETERVPMEFHFRARGEDQSILGDNIIVHGTEDEASRGFGYLKGAVADKFKIVELNPGKLEQYAWFALYLNQVVDSVAHAKGNARARLNYETRDLMRELLAQVQVNLKAAGSSPPDQNGWNWVMAGLKWSLATLHTRAGEPEEAGKAANESWDLLLPSLTQDMKTVTAMRGCLRWPLKSLCSTDVPMPTDTATVNRLLSGLLDAAEKAAAAAPDTKWREKWCEVLEKVKKIPDYTPPPELESRMRAFLKGETPEEATPPPRVPPRP